MHPLSKLVGLLIAVLGFCGVMWLEGGHPVVLLALPPMLMVLGISLGGIIASHGPRRVLRALAVAFGGRSVAAGEVEELRALCQRGHRLSYVAGLLQLITGTMHVFEVLDNPALIGPGLAYAMIGLMHAVLVSELGFASAERWIAVRAAPPIPAEA